MKSYRDDHAVTGPTEVRRHDAPGAAEARRRPQMRTAPGREEGSLVTEYGLIAIVGATIASLVVKWASGGAIWELFDAVTDHVRVLLGV